MVKTQVGVVNLLLWLAHVVNLENHLDQLGGKADLLLLANKRLKHMLLLHICAEKDRLQAKRKTKGERETDRQTDRARTHTKRCRQMEHKTRPGCK